MAKQLEIVAAAYPDQERANTILDALEKMHRASTITLADAALITKDPQGKIEVKETREVTTGKGARRGAVISGCLGIIYPPSLIASVLVGGGIGAFLGKLRDTGIKTRDMKEIATGMEPGELVVITLAEPQYTPAIQRTMEGWDGKFLRRGSGGNGAAQPTASTQPTASEQPETGGEPTTADQSAPADPTGPTDGTAGNGRSGAV
jgi:uncharacterized membrane protein